MDLIIRNAKLRGSEHTNDIGIENKLIVKIEKLITARAREEIDAAGCLTVPAFVDPHIHLDKALTITAARINTSGSLEESISIMRDVKSTYTVKDVEERATTVIRWAVKKGVTFIRSYVDVDPIAKLIAVRGVEKAKLNCRSIARVETIAFPQEGIYKEPGTEELLREAIGMGADVIGGMPANELIEEYSRKHIDFVFELAKKAGIDIQMHIDETDDPSVRNIHYLAFKTIEERFHGKVSADHVCALASYNDIYANFIISLIKKANMNIVSNPYRLMRGGLADRGPRRRGITRVKELLDAGVNVSYGQDVVLDGFSPIFGQCDPLEVGFLMAHAAQLNTFDDIKILFDMATFNGAKLMRLRDYGIKIGSAATMTVIDCPNIYEAFRLKPKRLYVIKDGKIIVKDEELIVS
jgi:cytosine deaminase